MTTSETEHVSTMQDKATSDELIWEVTGPVAAIAAACDLRLATRNLRFGFPIARTLANCLSAANIARVAMLTGVGRAVDMVMSTRLMGADEAFATGLVNELLDTPEALMARAH